MAGYSKNTIRRTTINNAISSSYGLTASYALAVSGGGGGGGGTPGGSDTQVQYNNGGSFGGVPTLIYSSSILIGTGSFSGSFTGSFYGTSSWAESASWAPGSTPTLPGGLNTYIQFNSASVFSGSNNLTFDYTTNSLLLTGSLNISGSIIVNQTLTNLAFIASTPYTGDNLLSSTNTGSYTSAFGKYTLYSSSNARAGEFVTVWNGNTVRYYDNATSDIGDTSAMIFYSFISSGQIYIFVAGQSGWTVKMLTTFI